MATNPRWAALPAVAAVTAVGIGCSSTSNTATTTSSAAPTTTAASPSSTAASPSTTAGGGGGGGNLGTQVVSPPSGASELQSGAANGASYWRYSITGTTPADVVSGYQTGLQGKGFTVTNQGGGGGGWGDFGGANAGLTANQGSEYVAVQAGGQNNGPTYFEVCQGPSSQSVDDCENISNGPNNGGGSNANSNSRPS